MSPNAVDKSLIRSFFFFDTPWINMTGQNDVTDILSACGLKCYRLTLKIPIKYNEK